MKVGILIYQDVSLWSAIGPMELLLLTNRFQRNFLKIENPKVIFDVEFVAASEKQIKTNFGYPIYCHSTINDGKKYDLILVPGFNLDPLKILRNNKAALSWISEQYECGTEIASFCTGAFLLAAAGILNNKPATTHWIFEKLFKEMYPQIKLEAHKVIVDNDNIYMSGGATTFQNLILYLVEKFISREVAVSISKVMLIELGIQNQLPFTILSVQKVHTDKLILHAQSLIEEKYRDKLSIDQLTDSLAVSERTFIRRFKNATGDTPYQYIQRVKVESAKKMLENEQKTFEEIVYEVGYEDISAFRKVFKKFVGISPSMYKKKYNRLCFVKTFA